MSSPFFFFFKILFIFFRERGREGKGRETLISCSPPSGDLAPNPGTCPIWEPNQPSGSQASAQPTEPHQPGQKSSLI